MNLGKKVKQFMATLTGNTVKAEQITALDKWQKRLQRAWDNHKTSNFDERELIYSGTHGVDKNINSSVSPKKAANNVRNIVYELIESQVDTTIPQPSVKAKRRGCDYLAQMAEESLKNDLKELPIQQMNDEMERTTPVQGYDMVMVNWNPDKKHHLYRGEIELRVIHPKQLVPQPGVWDLQKMDYFFVLSSVTRTYIKKRYGVDLGDEEREEYPEVNTLEREAHTSNSNNMTDEEDGKVTEAVCWYRDEDGDIGKFTFVNDTILEDLPKYYHRRVEQCQECGNENPQGSEQCDVCGSKKLKSITVDTEIIDEDKHLEPIAYGKTVRTVENGQVVEQGISVIDDRIIPKGTEIPYFAPTVYPIAIRVNVPKQFAFGGQSDVDIIRDQQDAVKKILTKVESKILHSGSFVTKLDDHRSFEPTNMDNGVVSGTQVQLNAIKEFTMQPAIQQDVTVLENMYQAAKAVLGINDTFQGKADPTAESGRAKQLQIERAAGRLASKLMNKYAFYADLYRIMFEFKLAFYDELRPFIRKNNLGEDDWGDFDKYQFLTKDASGEWYYNTDFIFTADAGSGLPNDKMWLYEQLNAQLGAQAIDIMQYWTLLEQMHFPGASMILQQFKDKQKEAEALAQQQMQQKQMVQQATPQTPHDAMMAQLPPEQQAYVEQMMASMSPQEAEQFKQLPPDQQVEAIARAMGGGQSG